jgi:hypothetical protein
MLFPYQAHVVHLPCRAKRAVISHMIYTVRPCLNHTGHAAPVPCDDHVVLKAASQGHGRARRSASSDYHSEFHEGCYQKHTNPLSCRTSSSDISSYHADFHEGHGTVGELHERGMGAAWARHGMCELAFTVLQFHVKFSELKSCTLSYRITNARSVETRHLLTLALLPGPRASRLEVYRSQTHKQTNKQTNPPLDEGPPRRRR